jgi:NAD(P) transhydrogenase subunit alpha
MLICFGARSEPDLMNRLKARKATVLAMDCVPRMSRAQKLDAQFDGEHRRLSRHCRSSTTLRPRHGTFTAVARSPRQVMVIGRVAGGGDRRGAQPRCNRQLRRAGSARPDQSLGAEVLDLDMKEEGAGPRWRNR